MKIERVQLSEKMQKEVDELREFMNQVIKKIEINSQIQVDREQLLNPN